MSQGSVSGGENLALTYRHGCTSRTNLPTNAQANKGSINAMFFDGHVARLDDRDSRSVKLWYPKGTHMLTPNEGMADTDDAARADFRVP